MAIGTFENNMGGAKPLKPINIYNELISNTGWTTPDDGFVSISIKPSGGGELISYIDDITDEAERVCTLISSSGAELTGMFVALKGRKYKITRQTLVGSTRVKFYKL